MLNVNDLPKPRLIEELSLDALVSARVSALTDDTSPTYIEGWTPDEADPITKVIRLEAYNEFMLRQRVNEAARQCLPAFARGTNLDHVLVPFLPDGRIFGEHALVRLKVTSSAPLILQPGYPFFDASLTKRAALLGLATGGANYVADAVHWKTASTNDPQELIVVCEIQAPAFASGNGLSGAFTVCDPSNPAASITNIEQDGISFGGSDIAESDARFLRRAQYAPSLPSTAGSRRAQYAPSLPSTAGSRRAYLGRAMGADARVMDLSLESPAPFTSVLTLLSGEGDGSADARMLARVTAALTPLHVRPDSETVVVQSATIEHRAFVLTALVDGEFQPTGQKQIEANFGAWARRVHRLGAYSDPQALAAAIMRGTTGDETSAPVPGLMSVVAAMLLYNANTDHWQNYGNNWVIQCEATQAPFIHEDQLVVTLVPYPFAGGLNG